MKLKRIIAIAVTLIMVFVLVGCSDTVEETSTVSWIEGGQKTDVTTDTSDKADVTTDTKSGNKGTVTNNIVANGDNPLTANLKGATINIYSTGDQFSPDVSSSKSGKAQAEMLKKLQSKLNCKLVVKQTTDERLKNSISTSAAAGKALCQIIDPMLSGAGYYVAASLVTDLARVSSMDLSRDYMQRCGIPEASRLGKGIYAIGSEGGDSRVFMIIFNKRILKELGYDENYIYNLAESGKWTLDAFSELSKKGVRDLDGKPGLSENDQYGWVTVDVATGSSAALFANAGVFMIDHDKNGLLKYNMENPNIINIATKLGNVARNGACYSDGGWQSRVAYFASGKAFMIWSPLTNLRLISSMKDDFGLVPSPKVSEDRDYTTAIDLNTRVLMMPAGLSAQDQANAGAFIQAYEYLLSDVVKTSQSEYANRYLRDEKSVKFMKLAQSKLLTDPSAIYGRLSEDIQTGTYRVIWDYLNDSKMTPMASAIESSKSATVKAINDVNAIAK
ncbi:MAG: hypothetical protein J5662_00255 [Clostridia bacterium]|nr:hypothetical protein [Clostridia bacterium]